MAMNGSDDDEARGAGGEARDAAEGAPSPPRALSAAARRALAEAAARRAEAEKERPREIGGRGGEDPVRYGDWEVKGLAVDF
jgi:hypothetical protein